MNFVQFIIANYQYIIPALISCCFLVVNIIQAIRSHNIKKLKELICMIPEVVRNVEVLFGKKGNVIPPLLSGNEDIWSIQKKSCAEAILLSMYGEAFVKKYIKVIDDAIEDILDTPQKKGGSNDGISKENEER